MNERFRSLRVRAAADAKPAADILAERLRERGVACALTEEDADVLLRIEAPSDAEDFRVDRRDGALVLTAHRLRGLLYAVGLFLRKTEIRGGEARLVRDLRGEYAPQKTVRGHQLGYRPTANSYEAWDEGRYRTYYLDLMFFGANTVEHIPGDGNSARNALMKYSQPEMCRIASGVADALDLDVSLWMPCLEESDALAAANAEQIFSRTPRIDDVFLPGSDPGELAPQDLFRRASLLSYVLKKYHPEARLWISAQSPHDAPRWGDDFLREVEKLPSFLYGVIQGPNRAMELDELRSRVPARYPIRLYPDITHNVRCEYPVHFPTDDWHYAWAACLSRESVDPRPKEMRRIHRMTRPYVVGSVSYSEGINDDFNKAVWTALDMDGGCDLRETALDYARLFFPGADPETVADALFGLEQNWESAPEEAASVEPTLEKWLRLGADDPSLYENWRYVMYLFRASCDALVRGRRIFDLGVVARARTAAENGATANEVKELLSAAPPPEDAALREDLERYAALLFTQIGLQSDVRRYHASGWERGAVLDTVDAPTTDRAYLAHMLQSPRAEDPAYVKRLFRRTRTRDGELYYSVAEHGLAAAGCPQEGYPYLNFRGDDPARRGLLATGMFDIYDNETFRLKTGGLAAGRDHLLRAVWLARPEDRVRHTVKVNGRVLFDGAGFGPPDPAYDEAFLPEWFRSAVYTVPGELLENGNALIELIGPTTGVMFCELFLTRKDEDE